MITAEGDTEFLFDISRQVKEFYETPVVFLTKKDFSDNIFNALCAVRTELKNSDKKKLIDTIVDFHLEWLHNVKEVEEYRTHIDDIQRKNVCEAICYTEKAIYHRLKYYQRYVEAHRAKLPNLDHMHLLTDLELIEEMHKEVVTIIEIKSKTVKNFSCDDEFKVQLNSEIQELLHWLDKIYSGLAAKISKYVTNENVPNLYEKLTKILQDIVFEIPGPAGKISDALKEKSRNIGSLLQVGAGHTLEISKIFTKMSILDDRIRQLEGEGVSAATLALKNKKAFLERRLGSLEKLKIELQKSFEHANQPFLSDTCICEDFYKLKIFNSELSEPDRKRLVTELCHLWDLAVCGHRRQSMISILSANELKELYTDELGTFYIDEYGRKIYQKPDDDVLYQIKDSHELVPLSDDADHVYGYDECGRYYLDPKTRERIYKAHKTASEYIMDPTGVLTKIKEQIDGIEYFYDDYGRYYVDINGKRIYRDPDSTSEYEDDGLGNLVRIRSHLDIFDPCPDDVNVTEDFKYLKEAVGDALRTCIAKVILYQPPDPIKYLSTSLIKYRNNIKLRAKQAREKEELYAERERIAAEERAAAERAAMEAALLMQGGSEASYDSNLLKYSGMGDIETPSSTEVPHN